MKYRDISKKKYQTVDWAERMTPIKDFYAVTPFITLHISGLMVIRPGYLWDGASGAIDTPDSIEGSLYHDAFYELMRRGLIPQECKPLVDQLLHDICEDEGMNPIRADIWEIAVSTFGSCEPGTYKDPIYEA